jgi:hypothetical protein
MDKKNTFTKVMATAGTVLVGLPLVAPVISSLKYFRGSGKFMLDFLMPFKIFPLVLLGTGLLLWAAIRVKSRLKLISWSFGAIVALMVLGLVLAVVSGMTPLGYSRDIDNTWYTIVLGFLAAPYAAQLVTIVGGFLLVCDLFKNSRQV